MKQLGFTLPELIVTVGIVLALFGIAAVNLVGVTRRSFLETTVDKLLIDIKEQQTRAMAGDTQGSGQQEDFTIYFEENKYTLSDSFEVILDPTVSISSVGFPGSTLVFEKISGEVVGFAPGADFVTVTDSASGNSKTIRLNRFGSFDVE